MLGKECLGEGIDERFGIVGMPGEGPSSSSRGQDEGGPTLSVSFADSARLDLDRAELVVAWNMAWNEITKSPFRSSSVLTPLNPHHGPGDILATGWLDDSLP